MNIINKTPDGGAHPRINDWFKELQTLVDRYQGKLDQELKNIMKGIHTILDGILKNDQMKENAKKVGREMLDYQLALQLQEKADVTLFSCSYFPEPEIPNELNVVHYRVPCSGSVMPRDVQEILENNSKKVAILSCEDCYYRLGKTWTTERFLRKRPPTFSKKYDASKLKLFTLTQYTKEKLVSFFQEPEAADKMKAKFNIADHLKGNHILSVIIMTLFFALMLPLSSTTVRFFNPAEKMLIVNFKYISSPQEYEQQSTGAVHMRALNPVVKKRSTVKLKISSSSDKKVLFEKEFTPRGLRHDIAMFIYSQLVLEQDLVDVQLVETAFPDKQLNISNVQLKKGDGTFVILKDGKLVVAEH